LGGDPEIAAEIAAQHFAKEEAVGTRNKLLATKTEDRPNIPYIAGYTDMANGTPDMRALGYARWLGMSPEQRFQASALGKALDFSNQQTANGKMAFELTGKEASRGKSYWAGLAKNVMYGGKLPTAVLPKFGDSDTSGVEGELPFARGGAEVIPGASGRPIQEQNTYTGFANHSAGTRQSQSPEGIERSALGNKDVQTAVSKIEELKTTDPEAAKEAEAAFYEYMRRTHGLSDSNVIRGIYNNLRGRA
jgi:hypothetical protein